MANAAELKEAFKRAKASEKTYIIVMDVDPYEGWTTEGHAWWEVGTPHVTTIKKLMKPIKTGKVRLKQRRAYNYELIDGIKGNKFVVFGRAGMDMFAEPIGTKSEFSESFRSDLGGSSANICAGLCKLGSEASLVTSVSNDAIGRFY